MVSIGRCQRSDLGSIPSWRIKEPGGKMKKEDIIVVKFAPNICYAKVTTLESALDEFNQSEKGAFSVDLENKTWSYKPRSARDILNIPIGNSRHISQELKFGIIGVYDRTSINHLDSMVHCVIDATHYEDSNIHDD